MKRGMALKSLLVFVSLIFSNHLVANKEYQETVLAKLNKIAKKQIKKIHAHHKDKQTKHQTCKLLGHQTKYFFDYLKDDVKHFKAIEKEAVQDDYIFLKLLKEECLQFKEMHISTEATPYVLNYDSFLSFINQELHRLQLPQESHTTRS